MAADEQVELRGMQPRHVVGVPVAVFWVARKNLGVAG